MGHEKWPISISDTERIDHGEIKDCVPKQFRRQRRTSAGNGNVTGVELFVWACYGLLLGLLELTIIINSLSPSLIDLRPTLELFVILVNRSVGYIIMKCFASFKNNSSASDVMSKNFRCTDRRWTVASCVNQSINQSFICSVKAVKWAHKKQWAGQQGS